MKNMLCRAYSVSGGRISKNKMAPPFTDCSFLILVLVWYIRN